MTNRKLIGVLVISVLLVTLHAVVRTARAQESGDTVVFLVPQGTRVTTGAEGDVVTYIAQSSDSVDVTGCAADGQFHPRQSVVIGGEGRPTSPSLVEPEPGEPPIRFVGLITLTVNGEPRTTDMPNGTRISNMFAPTQCFIATQFPYFFDKYVATVE